MAPSEKVLAHFRSRSARYNRSSSWVGDGKLLDLMFELARIKGGETVLDAATGTGLVAGRFKGRVKEVIGLDISTEMTSQAAANVDRMVIAPVESVPLPDASVDVVLCRQGLQFAELPRAAAEIARVLRPGGRTVLCHLCAYGDEDAADAFKIQALRNPARVNFFKPGDLEAALERAGLAVTAAERYLSRESIERWTDHGAAGPQEREAIKQAYRRASEAFRRLHGVEERGGDILDTMLLLVIRAERRR